MIVSYKSILFLFFSIVFNVFCLNAQDHQSSRPFTLRLNSGNHFIQPNIDQWSNSEKNDVNITICQTGYRAYIIQFSELPGITVKKQLESAGVKLLGYLPHYCYWAMIKENVNPARLKELNLRAIIEIGAESKLSPSLNKYFDSGSEKYLFNIHTAGNIQNDLLERTLKKFDFTLIESDFPPNNKYTISGPTEKLIELASVNGITYIEQAEMPYELEYYTHITSHRTNFLADNPGMGLNFTGRGVLAGISEGKVDNTRTDYKGRLDVSNHTGSVSGHATSVAIHLGGAGNQNPLEIGNAYGADILSYNGSFQQFRNLGAHIVNNSYGWNCNWPGYSSTSATNDNLVRNNPDFMLVYSAGNIGNSDCGYGAGPGWGNVTGSPKMAKNVIATGALNHLDAKMGFSSIGPATDGRIKPDMCAVGPGGTSFASPGVVGVMSILMEAYKDINNGAVPNASLLKAIMQNTAEDLGNPGPDFKFGYGRINARRSYNTLSEGRIITGSVSNNNSRNHIINVPVNTEEVRIMLYWADYEGTPGAAIALVNNLDLKVSDPIAQNFLPWVLDPTPNPVNLDADALRKVDTLNNMEQVTISNPIPGNFTITVDGTVVPQGPQNYFVVYEFLYNEIQITYPNGGEPFVPGETEIIRWDSYGGNGTFDIEYSPDSGQTWITQASNISANQRYYQWLIPDMVTGNAQIRVSRDTVSSTSSVPFSIIKVPTGLSVLWACNDSLKLKWQAVPGAQEYEVSRLGSKYMDSIGRTDKLHFTVDNINPFGTYWFSVKAIGTEAIGRRAIAINKPPGIVNCVPFDAAVEQIITHQSGFFPDCQFQSNDTLGIRILNSGVQPLINIPVGYQVNGGTLFYDTADITIYSANVYDFFFNSVLNLSGSGIHTIKAWVSYPGDAKIINDTFISTITVYNSATVTLPYQQDFDNFTNCTTAWGCEEIDCLLSEDWFNIPNQTIDSIDWRTNSGSTATSGTGPSNDHTQMNANGKYLYLETSGNGGSGCQDKIAYLYSPCIDLSNTNQPELNYWYHLNGSSIGELHIDAMINGEWFNDIANPITGSQGNNWLLAKVDLSAFTDQLPVLRFRGTTGSGWTGDMALDDIGITTLPKINFSSDLVNICPGNTVQFFDSSFYADSRMWSIQPGTFNYQNGTSDTSKNPVIVFTDTGKYTVTQIAINATGSDTLIKTHYVNAGPHHTFLASDKPNNLICINDTLSFTASSPVSSNFNFYINGSLAQSGINPVFSTHTLSDSSWVSVIGTVNPNCLTSIDSAFVRVSSIQTQVLSVMDLLCHNDSSGSLEIKAIQGIEPYSYIWSNGQDSSLLQDLHAGPYSFTVSDIAGCMDSNSLEIDEPLPIVYSNLIIDNDCFGDSNGSAQLSISGGIPNYMVNWSNGDNDTFLNHVPAGKYHFEIRDQNLCMESDSIEIDEPELLVVTMISKVDADCSGLPNGSVSVKAVGGVPPYQYKWSNGSTDSNLVQINGGNYSVTVTDSNQCEAELTIVIGQISNLIQTNIQKTDPLCYQHINGTATATASGGNFPYQYNWSNNDTGSFIDQLAGGKYYLTVTDSLNCIKVDSVLLVDPIMLTIDSLNQTNVACNGDSSGSVTVFASGGTGTLQYNWSNGVLGASNVNIKASTYRVTVTDVNNCEANTPVNIQEPSALQSQLLQWTDTICPATDEGVIELAPFGGTPGYAAVWSNGKSGFLNDQIPSGTYYVTITDTNNCVKRDSFPIINYPTSNVGINPDTSLSGCVGDTFELIADPGFIQYQWSNGDTTQSINIFDPGAYSVTVIDHYICMTSSDTVNLELYPSAMANLIAGPDSVNINLTGSFIINAASGSTVKWIVPNGNIINGQSTPTAEIGFNSNGIHSFYAIETTDKGCLGDTVFYQVTVFTPVGFNDRVLEEIRLFPNPNSGQFQIDGLPGNSIIEITNALGEKVRMLKVNDRSTVINLGNMSKGAYYIRIIHRNYQKTIPIIIE